MSQSTPVTSCDVTVTTPSRAVCSRVAFTTPRSAAPKSISPWFFIILHILRILSGITVFFFCYYFISNTFWAHIMSIRTKMCDMICCKPHWNWRSISYGNKFWSYFVIDRILCALSCCWNASIAPTELNGVDSFSHEHTSCGTTYISHDFITSSTLHSQIVTDWDEPVALHYIQWCIAKNGGGYTQRGVAKGLKVPCLFMITEVSIHCQKKTRRLVYGVYPHIPPNTPLTTSCGTHYSCCWTYVDNDRQLFIKTTSCCIQVSGK